MERLTRKMCGGWGVIPGYELSTVKGMKAVVDRLAAYEDTGLSVSDVAALAGKHTPKKPIKASGGGIRYTSDYRCPSCGGTFTGTGIADYCYHCGQRLDWKNH